MKTYILEYLMIVCVDSGSERVYRIVIAMGHISHSKISFPFGLNIFYWSIQKDYLSFAKGHSI